MTAHDQLIDAWLRFGSKCTLSGDEIDAGKWLLLACLIDHTDWPVALKSARYSAYLTHYYRDGQGLVFLCEAHGIANTGLAAQRLKRARKALFEAVRACL